MPPVPPCKWTRSSCGMPRGVGEDTDTGTNVVGVGQIPKVEVLVYPDGEEARESAVVSREGALKSCHRDPPL